MQRINGKSFSFDVGGMKIHADNFSCDITDNTTASKKDGRPDGYLLGDVEASGEITVDRVEMKAIMEAAKTAGSFQALKEFDINAYADAGDDSFKVEIFGCKLKMNKILDIDKTSTDKTQFTIQYDVTSPDFINIDGVPYITAESK